MIIALQALIFFRESLITAIGRFLRPYYQKISLNFYKKDDNFEDDEPDDHVFAEYDEERGVVFYPPVYAQRYAAVSDCLMDERWIGKLEKVVDFGYNDMSFIKYLKDLPGIKTILGVDLDTIPLQCPSDILFSNGVSKPATPLTVKLYQGNAADPDYRLIGCDAVVSIEMIEHMLPHDLERLIHTIFGFIKPRIAVITTPNGDFNVLFKSMQPNGLRRLDHFFEWSREQFHDWCSNIILRYPQFTVSCRGIGPGPPGTQHIGCCSQLALFVNEDYHKQQSLDINSLALVSKVSSDNSCHTIRSDEIVQDIDHSYSPNMLNCTTTQVTRFSKQTQHMLEKNKSDSDVCTQDMMKELCTLAAMLNLKRDTIEKGGGRIWSNFNWGYNAPYWNQYYVVVKEYSYPQKIQPEENLILDLVTDEINRLVDIQCKGAPVEEKLEISISKLMAVVEHVTKNVERVKDVLEWNGYTINGDAVVYSNQVFEQCDISDADVDAVWF